MRTSRTGIPAIVARMGALLLAAGIFTGPAAATQEYILPTLFDVAGVGPGDVLNIRATPSAKAEIIGAIPHDATGIEVVAQDPTGRWAQVNIAGRSGWVALRYLEYQVGVWESGELPEGLRCLGTEPFWALEPEGDRVVFSTPDAPDRELSLEAVLGTGIFRDPRRALIARGPERRLTATIVPTACSDGMSDRAYGLETGIVLEGWEEPRLLVGCCSISPRR